ncbi:MAG: hypothetical protein BGN84_09635 [Afipia sp. 62-7]|nr:MAG: hypothetical protein BGN84_09635 [Afipia sp. 62-7]
MRIWLFTAALLGAGGVMLGAFAAHGLAARLEPRALAVFDTGARYHLVHALAMALAALAMRGAARPRARIAAALFGGGILLFSGSLYLLALSGLRGLGMVTPLGGLCFVGGWVMLALAALKLPAQDA